MSEGTSEATGEVRRRRRNPEQTRRAIVEALLAALKEGTFVPTSKDIATRAGVSERSVFVHFPERNSLRTAAVEAQSDYVETLLVRPDPALPLYERIDAVVRQSEAIFTAQRNPRLLGLLESQSIPEVDDRMRLTDSRIRDELGRTFAPELTRNGSQDAELLDLAEATIGWAYRHQLTDRRGLSQEAASQAITRALRTLLSDSASEGSPVAR
ncbi:TetR/AcrR family transcriptional regulator [Nocardia jejuensis]|uniref:TetR/AcrR family transcriptional regulator n=1 Tax=Nocardia jejuensis TaxID=328049 RepID=UPI00082E01B8|nr:TetR/AcrR family transcriptional regulator [Nocardia jejuensis]